MSTLPLTVKRFPRGGAIHFREIAVACGVPPEVVVVETRARNTGENIVFSRRLLAGSRIEVESAPVACQPYQQHRAYATFPRL